MRGKTRKGRMAELADEQYHKKVNELNIDEERTVTMMVRVEENAVERELRGWPVYKEWFPTWTKADEAEEEGSRKKVGNHEAKKTHEATAKVAPNKFSEEEEQGGENLAGGEGGDDEGG